MREFMKHKKAQALLLGLGMILLAFGGMKLGLLPEDDPETSVNETTQALMMLIGSAGGLVAMFIGAQGYADGKSGGATATKALLIPMLIFGLGAGCAAPDGVMKAHDHMGKVFLSLANQNALTISLLGITDAEKMALLNEAKIDIDHFGRLHGAMGAYLESTDIFDQRQATEWIKIIGEVRAALRGAEGDGG